MMYPFICNKHGAYVPSVPSSECMSCVSEGQQSIRPYSALHNKIQAGKLEVASPDWHARYIDLSDKYIELSDKYVALINKYLDAKK